MRAIRWKWKLTWCQTTPQSSSITTPHMTDNFNKTHINLLTYIDIILMSLGSSNRNWGDELSYKLWKKLITVDLSTGNGNDVIVQVIEDQHFLNQITQLSYMQFLIISINLTNLLNFKSLYECFSERFQLNKSKVFSYYSPNLQNYVLKNHMERKWHSIIRFSLVRVQK